MACDRSRAAKEAVPKGWARGSTCVDEHSIAHLPEKSIWLFLCCMKHHRNLSARIARASSLFVIAVLSFPATSNAQSFNIGDKVLGLSVGIGGNYSAGSVYSSQTPALGLTYEQGVTDLGPGVLGIGGYIGYKSLSSQTDYVFGPTRYSYDWKWNYLIIGVRGVWHYNEWHGNDKLDTYGGVMLSYNSVSFKDNTNYPSGSVAYKYNSASGIGFTGFLGTRYWFSDNFGAHAELGYGIAVLNLGVSYKL